MSGSAGSGSPLRAHRAPRDAACHLQGHICISPTPTGDLYFCIIDNEKVGI